MSEDLDGLEAAEDLEPGLESDAVGRIPAAAHPAVQLTPAERAMDIDLALGPVRKWRRVSPHEPPLSCPLCGANVAQDHRARLTHLEDHKRRELAETAAGLPPRDTAVLSVNYASVAERATRHATAAVAVALACMLITAALIVAMTL